MNIKVGSNFDWGNEINDYIPFMRWGHRFYGEKYWQEEEDFIKNNFQGERILNVACGLFRELQSLKEITTSELIGLDYSESFINYINQEVLTSEDKKKVKAIQGDASDLCLKNNYFDISFILFGSLGILPEKVKALKSLADKSKDGGKVILSFWMDSNEVIEYRKKSYSKNYTRDVALELDESDELEYIIVRVDGKIYYKCAVMRKKEIESLLQEAYPKADIKWNDLEYCRILEITNFK